MPAPMTTESRTNGEDLLGLFKVIWLQKWIVIFFVFLFSSAAAFYAFTLTPKYEARFYISPPTANDISSLNYGRADEPSLKKITVDDVYKVLLRELQSESLRQSFYQTVYFPALTSDQKAKSTYAGFLQSLAVAPFDKDSAGRWAVSMNGTESENLTKWVRLYVEMAADHAKFDVIDSASKEVHAVTDNLVSKIKLLRDLEEKKRLDSIVRLREALSVAKKSGLDEPVLFVGAGSYKLAGDVNDGMAYMRGKKILEAELEVMEQRNSNDPYISGLRDLQAKYDVLKSLKYELDQVSVFDQNQIVEPTLAPIKSAKMFMVVVGALFGGLTGVVVAIIRGFTQSLSLPKSNDAR